MPVAKSWNLAVPLSAVGRKAVSYAAAQHGLSIRVWGAAVLDAGCRLAIFGDYLRARAEGGEFVVEEVAELVRAVEAFKIAADPDKRRLPLSDPDVSAIAARILSPLNDLVGLLVGRRRDELAQEPPREVAATNVTLCLTEPVHNRLKTAAATANLRNKSYLAQDLLQAAAAMSRVAGLKRQESLCHAASNSSDTIERISPEAIVDTWIDMLHAARCIPGRDKDIEGKRQELREALIGWYRRDRHLGVETVPATGPAVPTASASTTWSSITGPGAA